MSRIVLGLNAANKFVLHTFGLCQKSSTLLYTLCVCTLFKWGILISIYDKAKTVI